MLQITATEFLGQKSCDYFEAWMHADKPRLFKQLCILSRGVAAERLDHKPRLLVLLNKRKMPASRPGVVVVGNRGQYLGQSLEETFLL